MGKTSFIVVAIVVLAGFGAWWNFSDRGQDGSITPSKENLIRVDNPRPNEIIQSPLIISGQARGFWFFEASFPVILADSEGNTVARGIATAKNDWMTTEFVPFEATLTFTTELDISSRDGLLILQKDNPSGLPEYDDELEIPVVFADSNTPPSPVVCTQEAKICPDGSAVGRSGPNCEFAQCPGVNPIGRECNGPSDTSCPTDFECAQGCGPPVVRYSDDTPPSYFCQLKGYERPCPICLSEDTLIDTPLGEILIQRLRIGMPVWTVAKNGERSVGFIIKTSKVTVPPDHQMVQLALQDGRALLVSPGHPTIDGRVVSDLAEGDLYDGARVVTVSRITYDRGTTYDILPSGETGFYFANNLLIASTLNVN